MMKFIKLAAVVVIIVILDVADSEKLSKEQCERWNKVKKHKIPNIPNIHNIPRRCKWMTRMEAASVKKECRLCHEQYPICDLFCKEDGTKFLIACEVFRRGTGHYKMCKKCRKNKCRYPGTNYS